MNRKFLTLFLISWAFVGSFAADICCAANVKEPNVAGAFYPADKSELARLIQKYMDEARPEAVQGEPVVLISPHAGYIYSGPVAAYGFKALSGKSFETVIILAPSHYFPFKGASVYKEGSFRTPLGDIEVDSSMASALLGLDPKLLFFEPQVYEQEHSVEVELPFLQQSLKPGFKILPVLMGDMSYEECLTLAGDLSGVIAGKKVLVLVSTDMSHYKPYAEAEMYDRTTIAYIKDFDSKGLWDAVAGTGWNVCGIHPVMTGMAFAKLKDAKNINVLKYANSGDTAGDKTKVVGYMSVMFSKGKIDGEEDMLTKDEKKKLLGIARAAMEAYASGKSAPAFKESSPGLNLKRGVFVTLRKNKDLRGCIGQFTSDEPLYKIVASMAVESASHDYRFDPVTAGEVKDIRVEISVLSEPKEIDDWHNIRLGVDGVIVRRGYSSGVFLPQVATETGWDLDTFLGQLCSQKAGLPWDCYKDPSTKIYTFQAEVFSENE